MGPTEVTWEVLGPLRGQAGFAGPWGWRVEQSEQERVQGAVGKAKRLSTGKTGSRAPVVLGDPHLAVPCRAFRCATWRRAVARLPRARLGPRWGWAAAS